MFNHWKQKVVGLSRIGSRRLNSSQSGPLTPSFLETDISFVLNETLNVSELFKYERFQGADMDTVLLSLSSATSLANEKFANHFYLQDKFEVSNKCKNIEYRMKEWKNKVDFYILLFYYYIAWMGWKEY